MICIPGTDGRVRHHLPDKSQSLLAALVVMLRSSSYHRGKTNRYITAHSGACWDLVLVFNIKGCILELQIYVSVALTSGGQRQYYASLNASTAQEKEIFDA